SCLSLLLSFLSLHTHTSTTTLYTLSLHDALPISWRGCYGRCLDSLTLSPDHSLKPKALSVRRGRFLFEFKAPIPVPASKSKRKRDRKSTRLNSSHVAISYAVFCLKKKKTRKITTT